MKTQILRFVLAMFCFIGLASVSRAAGKVPAELDAMVEKAMKAFNDDDHKGFFADYSKQLAGAMATPEIFKSMYGDPIKGKLGKFVSKTVNDAETSINDEVPLVVYKAKFDKGEAKLAVNFMKEDGAYKIMQITIQP